MTAEQVSYVRLLIGDQSPPYTFDDGVVQGEIDRWSNEWLAAAELRDMAQDMTATDYGMAYNKRTMQLRKRGVVRASRGGVIVSRDNRYGYCDGD